MNSASKPAISTALPDTSNPFETKHSHYTRKPRYTYICSSAFFCAVSKMESAYLNYFDLPVHIAITAAPYIWHNFPGNGLLDACGKSWYLCCLGDYVWDATASVCLPA
jgi:hypothetical protein